MRIIKSEIIGHFSSDKKLQRNAIYSIDFQPGGNRLATGGGGISDWAISRSGSSVSLHAEKPSITTKTSTGISNRVFFLNSSLIACITDDFSG